MKALEILNHIKNNFITFSLQPKLDEAIAELEALESRSCEGCSRLDFDEVEEVYKCCIDVSDDVRYLYGEAVIRDIKDFCCKYWEAKQ